MPEYERSIRLDGEWVTVPSPTRPTPPFVWHHTTAAGLPGILADDRIWASSPLSLNDPRELTYGRDVVREVWEEMAKATPCPPEIVSTVEDVLNNVAEASRQSSFLLCATKYRESHSQWMDYSGEGGYAVRLDTEKLLAVATPDRPPDQLAFLAETGLTGVWQPVTYDLDEQRERARDMLNFILATGLSGRMTVAGFVAALIFLLKDPDFRSEGEVRFIAALPTLPIPGALHHRPGPGGLIPYVKLGHGSGGLPLRSEADLLDQRLPIVEVLAAPIPPVERDGELTSLRNLLDTNGYGAVPADVSYRPFPFR